MGATNGNLKADPLFCETGGLDLSGESPCAPGNSGECGLIGALGVACGTVAVTPTTWGQVKAAYRGAGEQP